MSFAWAKNLAPLIELTLAAIARKENRVQLWQEY